ncbi:hypothetical protein [Bradyrhizobium sp. BR 10289]|uniref:hypothetical protein n=1 Tax=Bradyrhizobium sp. BR 10289 TaxID=2749993 RepID=UPI001C64ACCB|nr:hypothetical protein [Bradyrhizobium sp. BR 10289]MBW7968238.1 hypothetical protein [Bradyrhizobium sp. BR 10289]
MNNPTSPARSSARSSASPVATAIRYLSIAVGSACLLLAAICFAIACQVFIQTGVFAQSYAMVCLISAALGCLALTLARTWK